MKLSIKTCLTIVTALTCATPLCHADYPERKSPLRRAAQRVPASDISPIMPIRGINTASQPRTNRRGALTGSPLLTGRRLQVHQTTMRQAAAMPQQSNNLAGQGSLLNERIAHNLSILERGLAQMHLDPSAINPNTTPIQTTSPPNASLQGMPSQGVSPIVASRSLLSANQHTDWSFPSLRTDGHNTGHNHVMQTGATQAAPEHDVANDRIRPARVQAVTPSNSNNFPRPLIQHHGLITLRSLQPITTSPQTGSPNLRNYFSDSDDDSYYGNDYTSNHSRSPSRRHFDSSDDSGDESR